MRMDLADDPAVVGMSARLDVSEDEIVGKLHRLWCWADRHTTDGRAPSITAKWVDRHVGLQGFSAELVVVGWLVFDDAGVTLPNFDRHNGKSAKSRAEAAERQRRSRMNVTPGEGEESDPEGSDGHADVTATAGQVSQKKRDTSVTREEKRREENKESGSAPPPPPPGEPLKAKSGKPKGEPATYDAWVQKATDAGEKPIPNDHIARRYAVEIDLPPEFLRLHWLCFRRRYAGTRKTYIDWGRVFHRSLQEAWFGLWFLNDDGTYVLTTRGKQAEIEFKEKS